MRFAINTQDAFDVDDDAVPPEQHGKSSEPESPALSSELFESSAQRRVILGNTNVANHPTINAEVAARLPLADVELFTRRLHGSTFQCRR